VDQSALQPNSRRAFCLGSACTRREQFPISGVGGRCLEPEKVGTEEANIGIDKFICKGLRRENSNTDPLRPGARNPKLCNKSDFFGEAESNFPTGWKAWDRIRVVDSKQLVLDWETPHIAEYVAFILLRLRDLIGDARDKYAETAKGLEKRIRRALKAQGTSGPD
jgi:hypothetical protein